MFKSMSVFLFFYLDDYFPSFLYINTKLKFFIWLLLYTGLRYILIRFIYEKI